MIRSANKSPRTAKSKSSLAKKVVSAESDVVNATDIQHALGALGDRETAAFLQGFFKTGPGEYGAGDVFRGIRVPVLHKLAAVHQGLALEQITVLLASRYHEDRLLALLILARRFARGAADERACIYRLYRAQIKQVNNWDLVDASAGRIVGAYLYDKDRAVLRRMARSKNLWERRIAIMATMYFINRQQYNDTLVLARMLLGDKEDLIHKAVGWMLREVGKHDAATEEKFLRAHCKQMPRTMLRYAIEKVPVEQRKHYLSGDLF